MDSKDEDSAGADSLITVDDLARQLGELDTLVAVFGKADGDPSEDNAEGVQFLTPLPELRRCQRCVKKRRIKPHAPPAAVAIRVGLQCYVVPPPPPVPKGKKPKPATSAAPVALSLRLDVTMPAGYPSATPPTLAITAGSAEAPRLGSVSIPRRELAAFNAAARELAADNVGCESVLAVAQWCQGHAQEYCQTDATTGTATGAGAGAGAGAGGSATAALDVLQQAFVLFHHMLMGKAHKKEQAVVALADTHGVSGLLFYGKPSIAVVEGHPDDIQEWIRAAKNAGKAGDVTLSRAVSSRSVHPRGSSSGLVAVPYARAEAPDLEALKGLMSSQGVPDDSLKTVLGH